MEKQKNRKTIRNVFQDHPRQKNKKTKKRTNYIFSFFWTQKNKNKSEKQKNANTEKQKTRTYKVFVGFHMTCLCFKGGKKHQAKKGKYRLLRCNGWKTPEKIKTNLLRYDEWEKNSKTKKR